MSQSCQRELNDDTIAAAEQMLKFTNSISANSFPNEETIAVTKKKTSATNKKKKKAPTIKRGRPKGKRSRSHPSLERPQRPLSAYNIFFKDERQKIYENKSKNEGVVVTFSSLAKTIANRWKNISEENKSLYNGRAAVELTKYKDAMKVYNEKLDELERLDAEKEIADKDAVSDAVESNTNNKNNEDTQVINVNKEKALPLRKRRFIEIDTEDTPQARVQHAGKKPMHTYTKAASAAAALLENQEYEQEEHEPSFMGVPSPAVRRMLEQHVGMSKRFEQIENSETLMTDAAATHIRRFQQGFHRQSVAGAVASHQTPSGAGALGLQEAANIVQKRAMQLVAAKRLVQEMQHNHDMALEAVSVLSQQQGQEQRHPSMQQLSTTQANYLLEQRQLEQQQHRISMPAPTSSREALLFQLQQEEQREQFELLQRQMHMNLLTDYKRSLP